MFSSNFPSKSSPTATLISEITKVETLVRSIALIFELLGRYPSLIPGMYSSLPQRTESGNNYYASNSSNISEMEYLI